MGCVSALVVIFFGIATTGAPPKYLLWQSNPSPELFAQFGQLRMALWLAQRSQRQLVALNFSSEHYESASLSLCDFFDLAGAASCNKNPQTQEILSSCLTSLHDTELHSNTTTVCFRGSLFDSKLNTTDEVRLGIMKSPPRLAFAEPWKLLYERHLLPLLPGNFSVAHWRRGDQLATRCHDKWRGNRDMSVNCATASAFVTDIRSHAGGDRNEAVIVATNERDKSTLAVLRAAPGFSLLSDLLRNTLDRMYSASSPPLFNRAVTEFVLESLAMLNAPILISIGVSGIGDIIETERQLHGRSFCTRRHDGVHSSCSLILAEVLEQTTSGLQGKSTSVCLDATHIPTDFILRIPRLRTLAWDKGLPDRCSVQQQEASHYAVHVLSQNSVYRLADIVLQKGARWKDGAAELMRPTWNFSLLHKVLNATKAASPKKNLDALFMAVSEMQCPAAPVSDNSTLVLHARMGDKEHIRAEFEPPLLDYLQHRSIKIVEINVVLHYAPWGLEDSFKRMPNLRSKVGHLFHMTNESLLANAGRLYDLIETVRSVGVEKVTVVSSVSVDENLCKFARSCHFLSTGGGFGEIAVNINRRLRPNCSSSTISSV